MKECRHTRLDVVARVFAPVGIVQTIYASLCALCTAAILERTRRPNFLRCARLLAFFGFYRNLLRRPSTHHPIRAHRYDPLR